MIKQVPTQIGKYNVVGILNQNNQAIQYLCIHQNINVVAKVFRRGYKQYYQSQVKTHLKLNKVECLNIIKMHEYHQQMRVCFQEKKISKSLFELINYQCNTAQQQEDYQSLLRPVIIFQAFDGIGLQKILDHKQICKKCSKLSPEICTYIFQQIIQTLMILFEQNIVMKKIKLANIIILSDCKIKIVNFSSSKIIIEQDVFKRQNKDLKHALQIFKQMIQQAKNFRLKEVQNRSCFSIQLELTDQDKDLMSFLRNSMKLANQPNSLLDLYQCLVKGQCPEQGFQWLVKYRNRISTLKVKEQLLQHYKCMRFDRSFNTTLSFFPRLNNQINKVKSEYAFNSNQFGLRFN